MQNISAENAKKRGAFKERFETGDSVQSIEESFSLNIDREDWRLEIKEKQIDSFWYKPSRKVGGINLKDATHSRFPRRYRQSKIREAASKSGCSQFSYLQDATHSRFPRRYRQSTIV